MPTLNIQYGGEQQAPDGSKTPVPPSAALMVRGPVIQVTLSVAQSIAEQLVQQGKTLPEPVSGLALIDTGASTTCIDDEAAKKLELPIINVVNMASATDASSSRNVYPVLIEIVGTPIKVNANGAIGANLSAQGLVVLIGRDVLLGFTLFYNGIMGQITLSL